MLLPLPPWVPILGPFGLSSFTLAALLGALGGRWLARRLAGVGDGAAALRAAVDAALTPLAVGAVVGGRLGNQLLVPDLTWRDPLVWFAVTGASLSYAGALVGAGAALWWSRRAGQPSWLALADLLAPGAALGLAVGWLGMPGTGRPAPPPFGLVLGGGPSVVPLQLYGLVGFALLALLLTWQYPRRDYLGQNVASLVALGSAFRFVLGFAVPGPLSYGNWSLTQWGDVVLAAFGIAMALRLDARGRPARRVPS